MQLLCQVDTKYLFSLCKSKQMNYLKILNILFVLFCMSYFQSSEILLNLLICALLLLHSVCSNSQHTAGASLWPKVLRHNRSRSMLRHSQCVTQQVEPPNCVREQLVSLRLSLWVSLFKRMFSQKTQKNTE